LAASKKKAPERWVRSTCPYCGVGCGLEVGVRKGEILQIRGDHSHPANFGKLCPKPAGLPESMYSRDRLTHPLKRKANGETQHVSWDEALSEVVDQLQTTIERHGPQSAAFYISGQLLTEDYYVVNKLAKGFLGTNNVDSNSRLCMSSAVAGYAGAFGTDGPPGAYADIGHAECVVLWGSNAAECHPVAFGRVKERKRDPKVSVIVVDPRRTPTADIADLHLRIKPGTDLALANAMLRILLEEDLIDRKFIERRTSGLEAAAKVAREWSLEQTARTCGIEKKNVVRAARLFGEAKAAMIFWAMGVNQSTVGTLKNRAIINLCLATGNVGKPGAGPFSLTGQPNAMGGRETGGLSQLLPGYRLVDNPEHRKEVERYWGIEPGSISKKPGLSATALFRALDEGSVKFLWVVATNPAASMPDLARVRRALAGTKFLVVQDAYPTETTRFAEVVLPVAGWGEKCGTMTNSERRVSIVEEIVEPPGEARADWKIFVEVARMLGFEKGFAWEDPAEIYAEYKELTRGRPMEITGLSHERLRRGPVQWPVTDLPPRAERPSGRILRPEPDEEHPGTPRLYADGRFNTSDGRARFVPTPHAGLHESTSTEYPLVLSTGRIKNQWHTMTRTGRSEKLMRGLDGPIVEVHPKVARQAGVKNGEKARVVSARGAFAARIVVTEAVEPGSVFAPFHWGDLWTDDGSVNNTTHDASDLTSGQPELKGGAVRVEAIPRWDADRRCEKHTEPIEEVV
jgi:ferredoxin-nitrate reductase